MEVDPILSRLRDKLADGAARDGSCPLQPILRRLAGVSHAEHEALVEVYEPRQLVLGLRDYGNVQDIVAHHTAETSMIEALITEFDNEQDARIRENVTDDLELCIRKTAMPQFGIVEKLIKTSAMLSFHITGLSQQQLRRTLI